MTVYPITLPDEAFASLRLIQENRSGVSESPWTGQEQIFEHQGQVWRLQAAYPAKLGRAQAEPIVAALSSLKGRVGSFLLGDTAARTPRGTAAVEPASANQVPNNTMAGAVVGVLGSGGALPTGWSAGFNPAGFTIEVLGIAAEDGVDYILLRLSNPTAVNQLFINFTTSTTVEAAQFEDWTESLFCVRDAGSAAGMAFTVQMTERDGIGTDLRGHSTVFTPVAAALKDNRQIVSANLSEAATAFVLASLKVNSTVTTTPDITIRIGLPQVEEQAAASAPIKTVNAGAVARPAGPVVFGAAQSGELLNSWGWPSFGAVSLMAGDYIQLGNGATQRLYKLTADIAADVEGKAALEIWPRLRESPADEAAIVTQNCKGAFRLAGDSQPWERRPGGFTDIAFAGREAI